MHNKRPKWIAIGKEQGKLQTKSQLLLPRKRNFSHSHSQVTEVTTASLVHIKSAKYLNLRETSFQPSKLDDLQRKAQVSPEISINIITEEDKRQIDKFIQNNQAQEKKQQQVKAMSHNHLPFYLRNQDYKVHYQMEPSQRSRDESHFDQEINQSVVLQAEDLQLDIERPQNSQRGPISNVGDEQSEIIEAMSFASSSNQKQIMNIRAPIVHYERGYRDGNELGSGLKRENRGINQQALYNKRKKTCQKVKLKLNQLRQMAQNLRVVQKTIIQEVRACQKGGKVPLLLNNSKMQVEMMAQLSDIIARKVSFAVERQSHKFSQSLSKLLNTAIQRGLSTDSSFNQLSNQQRIVKIIKALEQKSSENIHLKQQLKNTQVEADKTSSVLLSKLEEINELKQQLSKLNKQINQKSTTSMASQNTATFSPQFQKLLREKDLRGTEMNREIQELKQRNQQLMDEKEKLQEQVFTLQQKIIGVEMEVQQKVRQGIQEIRPVIEEQMRSECKVNQIDRQTGGNNQFFLQTIDTLSQQIKDLTQKCKYYEKYIREQEKNQYTQPPKSQPHQNQRQSKEYEQIISKRLAELQMRENTLLTIENQLTFKDKKLKELQNRLTKEATQFEKRQNLCLNKEQEIEKYLLQLNAREEELYVWEKQLSEEDKKLTRKTNELQREKTLMQNQKLHSGSMINQYPIGQVIESRNIISPYSNQYNPTHYPNTVMQKPFISSLQHQQKSSQVQPRVLYQRPQTYQPSYEAQYEDQRPSNRGFEKTRHNFSQQHIRYHPLNDSYDMKPPQMHLDHSELDISELRQNRISQKQRTQSMRVRGADFNHLNGQNTYSKAQRYRGGGEKLYLSSTYDKKSQIVDQILAKRRNQNYNNRNQRLQSRSPISINRNPLNDMFKKSQVRRIKSPLKNDSSFHTLKDITERKLKQRHERKRMFEKPSKDMSDLYKPMNIQGMASPKSFTVNRYPYDVSHQGEGVPSKQYTPRSFIKSSVPAVHNINEKLQKLKQEIKREVRDLQ